jgi:hypothetical protein
VGSRVVPTTGIAHRFSNPGWTRSDIGLVARWDPRLFAAPPATAGWCIGEVASRLRVVQRLAAICKPDHVKC